MRRYGLRAGYAVEWGVQFSCSEEEPLIYKLRSSVYLGVRRVSRVVPMSPSCRVWAR